MRYMVGERGEIGEERGGKGRLGRYERGEIEERGGDVEDRRDEGQGG